MYSSWYCIAYFDVSLLHCDPVLALISKFLCLISIPCLYSLRHFPGLTLILHCSIAIFHHVISIPCLYSLRYFTRQFLIFRCVIAILHCVIAIPCLHLSLYFVALLRVPVCTHRDIALHIAIFRCLIAIPRLCLPRYVTASSGYFVGLPRYFPELISLFRYRLTISHYVVSIFRWLITRFCCGVGEYGIPHSPP